MPNITWQRSEPTEYGVFSDISLDFDAWTGKGLERQDVIIPSGVFSLEWHISPHLDNARVLMLKNVPNREYILLHWGNKQENSDGCLLTGLNQSEDLTSIESTREACKELFSKVDEIGVESVTITILDA